MSKNPLVYIVLPVYNGEKYFLEQLMSLYYQNYTNWYLIIVNDGSTDGSEKIARDWISHYNLHDKVKILQKENGGLNSAITVGLKEIKKITDVSNSDSFVCYCDADDIWTRDKLDIQVNYMLDHMYCGLSYHDLVIIDENGIIINNSLLKRYWHNDSFIYVSTVGGCITASEIMFRVKYISDILPMPLGKVMAQDYWTILVLSLLGAKFGFINKGLAYHRTISTSMSKQYKDKFRISRQEYYKFLQERFPEKDLSYIIRCNEDWMINRRKNGRNIPYIVFRLMLKYPKVFLLCLRMFLYGFSH